MKKDNRSVIQTLTLIFQFGISMLVPIFLCSILGVWLGNLTGINWLMIPFFFMGALAGFTNIYKTVRKLYRQEEKKEENEGYIRQERRSGRVSRSFRIADVDPEKIEARLENGVLTLDIETKSEADKRLTIPIK